MKYLIAFQHQQTLTTIRSRWQHLFKWVFTVSICLLSIGVLHAQTPSAPIKELKIGDTIPDYIIRNIVKNGSQHGNQQLKMSDLYKEGLLLIDFWATWCVPCLEQIIRMDTLKQKFPKQFKSISVTYQDSVEIKEFLSLNSNKDIKTEKLLISTNDTLLSAHFPHRTIPHNIWIDNNGVIRYITGHEDVTEANIEAFLSDGQLVGVSTKSEIMDFDFTKRFDLGNDNFVYRSIISPFIEGINGGVVYQGQGHFDTNSRLFLWNLQITSFYWAAFSLGSDGGYDPIYRSHLIEVHTSDSLKFFFPTRKYEHLLKDSKYKTLNEWKNDNLFSYELMLPGKVTDSVLSISMFQDLDRFFKVKVNIENKKIPCIIVGESGMINNLPPTKHPSVMGSLYFEGAKLIATNVNVKEYFAKIYRAFPANEYPIIVPNSDENFRFDLTLDFSHSKEVEESGGISLELLMEYLKQYGFSFKVENHPYPILVLDDTDR